MKHKISVSEEYIESLCEWLEEWASLKDSWAIPQFLRSYGIGWSCFQSIMESHPKLHNVFEVVIAGLFSKWLMYGIKKKDMPQHLQKILMNYLRVYDNHAFYVDKEAKKEVAQNINSTMKEYAIEDYSKERLKGLYKSLYDGESNKRRG